MKWNVDADVRLLLEVDGDEEEYNQDNLLKEVLEKLKEIVLCEPDTLIHYLDVVYYESIEGD